MTGNYRGNYSGPEISEVLIETDFVKAHGSLFEGNYKTEEGESKVCNERDVADVLDEGLEITSKKYCALGVLMCNYKPITEQTGADFWQRKKAVSSHYMEILKRYGLTKKALNGFFFYKSGKNEIIETDLAAFIYHLNDSTNLSFKKIGRILEDFNL